ncbi:MAG: hypothetical protein GKR98_09745 [Boseongicola sp.]|nr:MAG: hypothetical protein GKR98_09745 [Boseongicola sp.]
MIGSVTAGLFGVPGSELLGTLAVPLGLAYLIFLILLSQVFRIVQPDIN